MFCMAALGDEPAIASAVPPATSPPPSPPPHHAAAATAYEAVLPRGAAGRDLRRSNALPQPTMASASSAPRSVAQQASEDGYRDVARQDAENNRLRAEVARLLRELEDAQAVADAARALVDVAERKARDVENKATGHNYFGHDYIGHDCIGRN